MTAQRPEGAHESIESLEKIGLTVTPEAADESRSASRNVSKDPYVSRALEAMKANPRRRWTVAELAKIAGLSRAAFARRFSEALGTSPLRWLTEHRLGLAAADLVETDLALAAIGAMIGYESEFAFAKAFKRLFGIAPGLFRRIERSRVASTTIEARVHHIRLLEASQMCAFRSILRAPAPFRAAA